MKSASTNKLFTQLMQQVAPQSKLLRQWPLLGGMSAEMIALEIETPNGQTKKMIVRRYRHNHSGPKPHPLEIEFKLLQSLQAKNLATPTPYHIDLSNNVLSSPYLLIEYIEGEMIFSPSNLDSYISQFAAQLANIHSTYFTGADLPFVPKHKNDCTEMANDKSPQLKKSLDETHIRNVIKSQPFYPQKNASTLLHGDYWPGNTLWQDGKLVAVIDWEDATIGDPLADFAISRLDIVWIFGIKAMQSFTEYYQASMAIDYTNLPYWDLCAALRLARLVGSNLAEWAAYFVPFGRQDITEQSLRKHYSLFVDQAFVKLLQR